VKKRGFKIEVVLAGVLEAKDTTELSLRPESWAQFVVEEVVEHGARVNKGDVLVALETKKIDEAIRDQELALRLTRLSVEQAEEDVKVLAKSVPMDLASAERSKKHAEEDAKRFLEIDKALSQKSAHFSVKNSTNGLEYAREELRQLEKMYKADDLTEETEEIILKRQRNNVERAEFNLERAKVSSDRTLKVDLPRREVSMTRGLSKARLNWEKARAALPMQLRKKHLDLEKMKYDRKKTQERIGRLKKDRAAMAVKAPMGGIVYYGRCVRGVWPNSDALAAKLRCGGALKPHEVFMTVARPRPVLVRAQVPEERLHHLVAGMEAKIVPKGYPSLKLKGRLESISAIPTAPGKFDAMIAVELPQQAKAIMPGMACNATFVPYAKRDALTAPAVAVFSDPLDEEKRHVYVAKPDQQSEKRPVTVGRTSAGKVEILKGLEEGEKILLKEPDA